MNARLCSLLVAGRGKLVVPNGSSRWHPRNRRPCGRQTLQKAFLRCGWFRRTASNRNSRFHGCPRLQVLSSPYRGHRPSGVNRGNQLSKRFGCPCASFDSETGSPTWQSCRYPSPGCAGSASGTQVTVSKQVNGIDLVLLPAVMKFRPG